MKDNLDKLIESNSKLVATNSELVGINKETISMTKEELSLNKELMIYAKEVFQALSDKRKRSIQEETQYLFLRKILIGR